MTNDLINRAAAQQAIRALCDTTDCNIAVMPDVAEVLREVPAVDVVPMVHSRWIHENGIAPAFKCMECRRCNFAPTPYCPRCGAKMDEEASNDQ